MADEKKLPMDSPEREDTGFATQKQTEKDDDMSELRRQLLEFRTHQEEVNKSQQQTNQEQALTNKEQTALIQRLRTQLEDDVANLQKEIDVLKRSLKHKNVEIVKLCFINLALKKNVSRLMKTAEDYQRDIENLKSQLYKQKQTEADLRSRLADRQGNQATATSEAQQDFAASLQEIRAEKVKLEEKIADLQEKLVETEVAKTFLMRDKQEVEEKVRLLEEGNHKLEEENQELQRKVSERDLKIQNQIRDYEKLAAKDAKCQKELHEMRDKYNQTTAVWKEATQNSFNSVKAAICEHLERMGQSPLNIVNLNDGIDKILKQLYSSSGCLSPLAAAGNDL